MTARQYVVHIPDTRVDKQPTTTVTLTITGRDVTAHEGPLPLDVTAGNYANERLLHFHGTPYVVSLPTDWELGQDDLEQIVVVASLDPDGKFADVLPLKRVSEAAA